MFTTALGIALATAFGLGAPLPPLKGEYLTKQAARLPQDAAGKVALLALGFTYGSRFAVENWTKRFRTEFRDDSGTTFFEIPLIGGMSMIARPFIDGGMRKGTPKELHRNVITVYGGTGDWKKRVQFSKDDYAYLLLLDPQGRVRWMHGGLFDEARFAELARLARQLADERTPPSEQH